MFEGKELKKRNHTFPSLNGGADKSRELVSLDARFDSRETK